LPLDISIETRTIIISHEGVYFGKLVACIHLDPLRAGPVEMPGVSLATVPVEGDTTG
jgi:hypothetical protein